MANHVPFIPGWSHTPIPNFSLSAGGLLALADLSTIAQRTALRGGSSWLDSLLLAPGLHYQQAADELARAEGTPTLTAVEASSSGSGPATTYRIVNQAVISYILRSAKEGKTVVLDVGELPVKSSSSWSKRRQSQRNAVLYGPAGKQQDQAEVDIGWVANLLYLTSPLLTCAAIVIVVLLGDWWALALILGLMASRLLNIIVIKLRARPKPQTLPHPFLHNTTAAHQQNIHRISQYVISLSPDTTVILRGLSTDLYALTTTVWLRPKSPVEGYLEAVAKMLVFLVAAVSGNATQAGNLVLAALLLASAGLLALSNSHTTGLRNSGKMVSPSRQGGKAAESGGRDGRDGIQRRAPAGEQRRSVVREYRPTQTMDSWPSSSTMST